MKIAAALAVLALAPLALSGCAVGPNGALVPATGTGNVTYTFTPTGGAPVAGTITLNAPAPATTVVASAPAPAPAPAPVVATTSAQPSLYAKWSGFPQDPAFFPIGVWWQGPTVTGQSAGTGTLAAAVKAANMNMMIGVSGTAGGEQSWPERFGSDDGELEAVKAAGVYLIGGIRVSTTDNTSASSVASMLALASSIGASSNLIGYNMGDEPDCTLIATIPAAMATLKTYDPTRMGAWNMTAWPMWPFYEHCLAAEKTALQAVSVASADVYPAETPWDQGAPLADRSDFLTKPSDRLYRQGLMVQALRLDAAPGEPVWAYLSGGGDNFGGSESGPQLPATLTAGSPVIVNTSGYSVFTSAWVGLTIKSPSLPGGVASIVSVQDPTHATLSAAATTALTGGVSVGGGYRDSACVMAIDTCLVSGNAQHSTPAMMSGDAWMSIINGANGLEWFCHDAVSYSYCLGDPKGGAGSALAYSTITWIDASVAFYGGVLNSPTAGICSMLSENYTDGTLTFAKSCANGGLTLTATASSQPAAALVKTGSDGATYVFVQPMKRGGGTYTVALAGSTASTATVVFDTDAHLDAAHSQQGVVLALTNGAFSITLGQNGDDYQTAVIRVQ